MSQASQTVRAPWPEGRDRNGRPVWEPPILDYSRYIDQEDYDNQRKVVLKRYEGDVVQTTKFLDAHLDFRILNDYMAWAAQEHTAAAKQGASNYDAECFFDGLLREIKRDENEAYQKFAGLGFVMRKDMKGKYIIHDRKVITTQVLGQEGHVSSASSGNSSLGFGSARVVGKTVDGTTELDLMDDLAALELSQPTAQIQTSATETTPLISTINSPDNPSDEDSKSAFSTIICGCPCS